jgi:hypothetical protein
MPALQRAACIVHSPGAAVVTDVDPSGSALKPSSRLPALTTYQYEMRLIVCMGARHVRGYR